MQNQQFAQRVWAQFEEGFQWTNTKIEVIKVKGNSSMLHLTHSYTNESKSELSFSINSPKLDLFQVGE